MMRCIDHPTMVKDGSGFGALAGVSAAYLAAEGFTGAPAELVERFEHQEHWADLGARWRTLEHYVKPHPVCRWAQPAIEAALALKRRFGVEAKEIERVEVTSFHQAVRLAARAPATTEQAQYSLPFPLAAALVRDRLGPSEIGGEGLREPAILRLSHSMVLAEQAVYNARFPAERWAQVAFILEDGRRIDSEPTVARGGSENFFEDDELCAKYRVLAEPVLGRERTARIERAVFGLAEAEDIDTLVEDLLEPA
jgi:2-methylcitrate dehydratase PrpD